MTNGLVFDTILGYLALTSVILKVTVTLVIKCVVLGCTLVPSIQFLGETISKIWTIVLSLEAILGYLTLTYKSLSPEPSNASLSLYLNITYEV